MKRKRFHAQCILEEFRDKRSCKVSSGRGEAVGELGRDGRKGIRQERKGSCMRCAGIAGSVSGDEKLERKDKERKPVLRAKE